MAMPTIRDVAKKANVSVATVSRVINGSAQVKLETKEKVLAIIEELNFSPHTGARQLSGGKTYTIGVLTPFFTRPSFVERLAGIREVLDLSEYELVIYSIKSLKQLDSRIQDLTNQNRVDGLITLSVHIREKVILEARPDLPIVAIDDERIECYPSIVIDNIRGGEIATEYLIKKGYTELGFIGDAPDAVFNFVSTQRRLEGFQNAYKKFDLTFNQDWVGLAVHGRDTAKEVARELLSKADHPRGIVVASDIQAFGVITAARELGLSIPDDVAIIGFDDIEAAEYMNLTTVRAHMRESGRVSARYLLDWIKKEHFALDIWQTVLPLEIVERQTV